LGRERLLPADDENRNRRELLVRAQRLAQLDPVLRGKRRVEDGQVRRRLVDALERLRAIGHGGHRESRLAQRDLEDAEAARIRVCDEQGGLWHETGSGYSLQATGRDQLIPRSSGQLGGPRGANRCGSRLTLAEQE